MGIEFPVIAKHKYCYKYEKKLKQRYVYILFYSDYDSRRGCFPSIIIEANGKYSGRHYDRILPWSADDILSVQIPLEEVPEKVIHSANKWLNIVNQPLLPEKTRTFKGM